MNQTVRTPACSANSTGSHWKELRAGIFLVTVISAVSLAQDGAFRPDKATTVTPVNQLPDANTQWEINKKRSQVKKFEKANLERKRQMDEDSSRLFQLAAELNAELEKAGPDVMPLTAVEKAEMVEKLAHAVKEKMKLTMAN
jgi:hypothetical protein